MTAKKRPSLCAEYVRMSSTRSGPRHFFSWVLTSQLSAPYVAQESGGWTSTPLSFSIHFLPLWIYVRVITRDNQLSPHDWSFKSQGPRHKHFPTFSLLFYNSWRMMHSDDLINWIFWDWIMAFALTDGWLFIKRISRLKTIQDCLCHSQSVHVFTIFHTL